MTNGTQQLPQEKYADELVELDESIQNLMVLYEKYFIGIDRKPPDQERKRVSEKAREMRTTTIRNTALKFKINTLFAKLISFERMWDRTLREMEEGTYKRDVFKAKLHLKDRGLVKTGHAADLALFDPKTVRDEATFPDPHRHPAGIPYVVVNGQVVVDGPRYNAVPAGRVLAR